MNQAQWHRELEFEGESVHENKVELETQGSEYMTLAKPKTKVLQKCHSDGTEDSLVTITEKETSPLGVKYQETLTDELPDRAHISNIVETNLEEKEPDVDVAQSHFEDMENIAVTETEKMGCTA